MHPAGKGSVVELRRRVSAVVAAKLFTPNATPAPGEGTAPPAVATKAGGPPRIRVSTGLDVLESQTWAPLKGKVVGLVTNQTGVNGEGRRNVNLLASAPGREAPGDLLARARPRRHLDDAECAPRARAPPGRPCGASTAATGGPPAAMLQGLDTLVFDIQDVGVRYYTYLTTLVYVLEEAARHGIAVVVLDRPDPLTGAIVEGPVMDPDLRSFTAPASRSRCARGMTIGEFAQDGRRRAEDPGQR